MSLNQTRNGLPYVLIFFLSVFLFVPFLGGVHLFDWDEINFAECAREMIVTKDYLQMQIDFQPFYEKPPLFIWMQVLSMKVFGINEFAARFPNAVTGFVTLCVIFSIGSREVSRTLGMWWVALFLASWLPHFYFKSGIIDPSFNLFIFLSIYFIYRIKTANQKWFFGLLAGIFLGLALLTKGPVAALVVALCILTYFVIRKGLDNYNLTTFLWIALFALLITASWLGIELATHGPRFLQEFITYQIGLLSENIAGHEQGWYYHPLVLLFGCFPASVFLFQYVQRKSSATNKAPAFSIWMWIMFWVVLILFSIVRTKIVHYSSLCYFPLTFLAAMKVYKLNESNETLSRLVRILIMFQVIVWGVLLSAVPLIGIFKNELIPYIKDPFAVGNLQAAVNWHPIECGIGLIYLLTMGFAVFFMKKDFRKAMLVMIITQVFAIQIAMTHFTPKIEGYSQRAAVSFYKSMADKDIYIQVGGFKSYAHLFYSQKRPATDPRSNDLNWLLTGRIDKPFYLVTKSQDKSKYQSMAVWSTIQEKNGFVFFHRAVPRQ